MQKPKVATVWCEGCAGCHMSFLDLDEALMDVLSKIELTVTPITDFKDFDFPEVALGIIEGGVGNEEQLEIVRHMRKRAEIVMAWGDCAVFGGINTLRNRTSVADVLHYGFIKTASTVNGIVPDDSQLPKLLDHVLPVNAIIKVDCYIPGCPPSPEAIVYGLTEILNGRLPVLPRELIHYD